LTAACLLLLLAAIGGVYFAFFPAATLLDRLGEWAIPNEWHSPVLRWTVARGLPVALVLGAALSCVTAAFWDRRRAVTCVVAPPVAIAITEYLMKPLVGRPVPGAGVIGLAYPSGHMTAAAAVVGVAVLAVPPPWRKLALLIGTPIDVLVAVCLILLRYHYVTDIIAGTAVAVGTTLLVDTALHLLPAPIHLGHLRTGGHEDGA
jgi:membrane-associated phospholipid phosphatase